MSADTQIQNEQTSDAATIADMVRNVSSDETEFKFKIIRDFVWENPSQIKVAFDELKKYKTKNAAIAAYCIAHTNWSLFSKNQQQEQANQVFKLGIETLVAIGNKSAHAQLAEFAEFPNFHDPELFQLLMDTYTKTSNVLGIRILIRNFNKPELTSRLLQALETIGNKDAILEIGMRFVRLSPRNEIEVLSTLLNISDAKAETLDATTQALLNKDITKLALFLANTDRLVDRFRASADSETVSALLLRAGKAVPQLAGIEKSVDVARGFVQAARLHEATYRHLDQS